MPLAADVPLGSDVWSGLKARFFPGAFLFGSSDAHAEGLQERAGPSNGNEKRSPSAHPSPQRLEFTGLGVEPGFQQDKHRGAGREVFQVLFPAFHRDPQVFQPEVENFVPERACAVSRGRTRLLSPPHPLF